jgi:hypothetical protein
MYSIYGLIDPRCLKVFYVGRTSKSLKKRLNEHLSDTDRTTLKRKRMLEISAVTDEPVSVVELEGRISTEKEAFCREVFWIETMIKSGSPLTNAAIDFAGTYFLREDTLESVPDVSLKPVVTLYTSASEHWSGDSVISDDVEASSKLAAMDGKYFKVEEHIKQGRVLQNRNMTPGRLNDMRLANMNAGRKLNHGLPIFDEEIGELLRRFEKNSDIAVLSNYFQRTEVALRQYIEEALGGEGDS